MHPHVDDTDLEQVVEIVQVEIVVRLLRAVVAHKLWHSVARIIARSRDWRRTPDLMRLVRSCASTFIIPRAIGAGHAAFWGSGSERVQHLALVLRVPLHGDHVGRARRDGVEKFLVVAIKSGARVAAQQVVRKGDVSRVGPNFHPTTHLECVPIEKVIVRTGAPSAQASRAVRR